MKPLVPVLLVATLISGLNAVKVNLKWESCSNFVKSHRSLDGCLRFSYPELGTEDVLMLEGGEVKRDTSEYVGAGTLGPTTNLEVEVKSLDDNLNLIFRNGETGKTHSVRATAGKTFELEDDALTFDTLKMNVDLFKRMMDPATAFDMEDNDLFQEIDRRLSSRQLAPCDDLIKWKQSCQSLQRQGNLESIVCSKDQHKDKCKKSCGTCPTTTEATSSTTTCPPTSTTTTAAPTTMCVPPSDIMIGFHADYLPDDSDVV